MQHNLLLWRRGPSGPSSGTEAHSVLLPRPLHTLTVNLSSGSEPISSSTDAQEPRCSISATLGVRNTVPEKDSSGWKLRSRKKVKM